MNIKPGDPVKLTSRYANALMCAPRCKVNWLSRRGVVATVNRRYVSIKWDGNRSNDKVCHAALVKLPN